LKVFLELAEEILDQVAPLVGFSVDRQRRGAPWVLCIRGHGTPEENKAVVEGSIAYYDSYSIGEMEKIITINVEGSTFANQINTVQKRLITSITPNEMTFTNPATTSGGSVRLVWRLTK
jgi:hypothetical protein